MPVLSWDVWNKGACMIVGKFVRLRLVEERDLALIARWRNAPENRRFFFSPFLINPDGQPKWYENLLADRARILFMVEALDGRPVGVTGIDHIDYRNQEAECGQIVLDPAERGRGYAHESSMLAMRYAFEELNMHRLYVVCMDDNVGVIQWAQYLGFRQEGVLRQSIYRNGRFHDRVILAVLREEWQADMIVPEGED